MYKLDLKGKHLKNSKPIFINGMQLTNANGAIDPSTAGYNYVTEVLSEIRSQVIKQKFYRVAPAEYMPVDVGEAAWKTEIVQNLSYDLAGGFFDGDVDTMTGNGRLANVDTFLKPIRQPTVVWAKGVQWNISEISQAAAGNWDIVSDKMESLKRNWDLGIQEVAFLGHPDITTMTGLLNNSEVTINTTLIPVSLSSMSETQFTTFLAGILSAYWENSKATELPNTFLLPTDDYLGLSVPYSSTFPGISKLEYMLNTFRKMTRNPNFEVKPLAYCQDDYNSVRSISKNRYVLYNNAPEVLKLSIPVDFTMYDAGTSNNIFWQQPAVAQYSGVLINRVPEVLYLDETAVGS